MQMNHNTKVRDPTQVKIQRILGRWRISLENSTFTASKPVMIRVAFAFVGRIKGFEYVKVLKWKTEFDLVLFAQTT